MKGGFRILQRVPAWIYVIIFALGLTVLGYSIYKGRANSEAVKATRDTELNTLHHAIAGINFEFEVYRWSGSMVRLRLNGPLTTLDSYAFELEPVQSSCAKSKIQRIAIELLSAAFSYEPSSDPLSVDVATLDHKFCTVSSVSPAAAFHWDVLAKQEGNHVVAFRVIGLDRKRNKVSEQTLEFPIVVANNPFTVTAMIGALGAAGGFIGVSVTILVTVLSRRQ